MSRKITLAEIAMHAMGDEKAESVIEGLIRFQKDLEDWSRAGLIPRSSRFYMPSEEEQVELDTADRQEFTDGGGI